MLLNDGACEIFYLESVLAYMGMNQRVYDGVTVGMVDMGIEYGSDDQIWVWKSKIEMDIGQFRYCTYLTCIH